MFLRIGLSIIVNGVISFLAYRKRQLDRSGQLAAFLLGSVIFATGHRTTYVLMMSFFLSSGLIKKLSSKLRLDQAEGAEDVQTVEKYGRNYKQVLANGSIGLVLSVLYAVIGDDIYMHGANLSFAVTTADTWASEIGIYSRRQPIMLLSRRRVPPGLSGGITRLGLLASLGGSGFIALIFLAMRGFSGGFDTGLVLLSLEIAGLGFFGAIIDSLLGETIQAKYISQVQHRITEKRVERGNVNQLISGWRFIDNNIVNFLSVTIIVASFVAYYFWG